jgi:hypothetical protein
LARILLPHALGDRDCQHRQSGSGPADPSTQREKDDAMTAAAWMGGLVRGLSKWATGAALALLWVASREVV